MKGNDRARARISVHYVSRQQSYVGGSEHLSTETSLIEILIVFLGGSVLGARAMWWGGAGQQDKGQGVHG